jgi:uncharacterized protein (TIGR03437 family)
MHPFKACGRALLLVLFAAAARAQCPNSIVAGPPSTYAGDGQPAISAWLLQPKALTLDAAGNLYIADSGNNRVRKVTTDGVIHTVAGPDILNDPEFVLAAPDGSVYVADTGNNRIRQITAAGAVNVVAGTGHPGFSGDNGAAAAAELNAPTGMALDAKGRLYFADTYNSRVRRIDTNGVITTVAGGVTEAPAGSAMMSSPQAVAIAADGSILVGDTGGVPWGGQGVIWRVAVDGTTSTLETPSGTPVLNLTMLPDGSLLIAAGDLFRLSADGSALSYYARTQSATSAAVGPSGIYYTSTENVVYRAASTASEPAIFAGQHYYGDGADNVSALGPIFGGPGGIAVGPDGSIWVADGKIRKILPDGAQRVIGPDIGAYIVALDPAGTLYAATLTSILIVAPDGTSRLFAGGGNAPIPPLGAPAMPATAVDLGWVQGVVTDSAGNVYVLSWVSSYLLDSLITRITPTGQLSTIFDSTAAAGPAQETPFADGLALDAQGYLAVPGANRQIFRIATDGSGIFQTLTAPDYAEVIATAPSGEIFYFTTAGRIEALHSGATIYNRDANPDPLPDPLLTYPVEYLGAGAIAIGGSGLLATDALGNLYAVGMSPGAISRFPVGPCFTVSTPKLSADLLPSPITPQPPNQTTSTTTTGTTTTAGTTGVTVETWSFAPGELISLYGSGLGPQTGVNAQAGSNGIIATQLAGTRVLFQGVPAPVLYASDGRVNTVVPFTMYGYPQVLVQVESNGVLSNAIALTMSQSAPIVFTNSDSGQPVAIVVNQDGSINSPAKPAAPGSIVTFYGSGFGRTTPAGIDGHLAAVPLPQPVLPISVTVDDETAAVLYAGDASGMVEGVVQLNIQVPEYVYQGAVSVTVGNSGMQFSISVTGNVF